MSPIADMSAHPSVFGVVTRMPKRQRPAKHARIKVKLDTVMGVAREMGRLIRLSYNGHLAPEELTKYIFALDKLRACLESAINIDLQAQANAPSPPPPATTINILSVPSGVFVDDAMRERINENADSFDRRPLIDHAAEPTSGPITLTELRQSEPPASTEVPIDQGIKLQSPEEARLIAELNSLTDKQLMDRAIQCGLDPSLLSSSSSKNAD